MLFLLLLLATLCQGIEWYSLVWGVTQTTTTTTVLKTTTQCWSSSTTLTVCKKKKRKRAIEEQPPLIVARARQLPVFPLETKIEESTLDGEDHSGTEERINPTLLPLNIGNFYGTTWYKTTATSTSYTAWSTLASLICTPTGWDMALCG